MEREDGIDTGVIESVVLCRLRFVVVRSGEAVDEVRPQTGIGMLMEDLCHILKRFHDTVHLLDVSVLTGDVALHYLMIADESVARRSTDAIAEDLHVLTGESVLLHKLRQEVDHRCGDVAQAHVSVAEENDVLMVVAIPRPCLLVGTHLGVGHGIYRVKGTGRGRAAHSEALLRWRGSHVAHQFDEVSIVDDLVVEQQLLLGG